MGKYLTHFVIYAKLFGEDEERRQAIRHTREAAEKEAAHCGGWIARASCFCSSRLIAGESVDKPEGY